MHDPAAVDGVSELVLEVSDLERAERFYTDTLGLPVVERWPHRDAVWVLAGRTRIGLWKPQVGLEGSRGGAHVHFAMQLPEQEFEPGWRRCGVTGHEVPVHEFGPLATARRAARGIRHDPDGHLVEFWTADMRDYTARQLIGGRRSAQGRAASIWAASERSVASSFGCPTSCTDSGMPASSSPAGTEAAGWPVRFQIPVNGQCQPAPFERADRAATLPLADPGRGAGRDRRHEHVEVPEQGVDARGDLRLGRAAAGDASRPARVHRAAPCRACAARAVPGSASHAASSWMPRRYRRSRG